MWSCGLRVADTVPPVDAAASQAVCDAYALVIHDWFAAQPLIDQRAKLTTVKMNWIGTDGKYIHPYTSRVDYAQGVPAVGNGAVYPNQVSIVITLGTGVARGLAHQGRIYLPLPSKALGEGGVLTLGDQNYYADEVFDLLNSLNALDGNRRVAVMSKGTPKTPQGTTHLVTTVEVGAVLDTMRSRRSKIPESRVIKPLTTP
jgi:hypothetical protein